MVSSYVITLQCKHSSNINIYVNSLSYISELEPDKYISSGTIQERSTIEGNSPVDETTKILRMIQSTTRHVKPCGKQGGPPPKAKYSLVTDSV